MSNFFPKGKIKYVDGKITLPHNTGFGYIVVPCDMSGNPSSDLFNSLGAKWNKVISEYKFWFPNVFDFKLGNIKDALLQSDTAVVYLLCQDKKGKLNEEALNTCIDKLIAKAKLDRASLHFDASVIGKKSKMFKLVSEKVLDGGINVLIYGGSFS